MTRAHRWAALAVLASFGVIWIMDAGYLHIELHSIADEIRAGFKGGEDA